MALKGDEHPAYALEGHGRLYLYLYLIMGCIMGLAVCREWAPNSKTKGAEKPKLVRMFLATGVTISS